MNEECDLIVNDLAVAVGILSALCSEPFDTGRLHPAFLTLSAFQPRVTAPGQRCRPPLHYTQDSRRIQTDTMREPQVVLAVNGERVAVPGHCDLSTSLVDFIRTQTRFKVLSDF